MTLQRNIITNRYGVAGSCITNDAGYGVADEPVIAKPDLRLRRDETHDHGIYTNAMDRPIVRANWIYENAGRGINLGPATQGANIYRNVIADNCANPLGGLNDCSANVMFWGSTSGTTMNNNTIAFPHFRWNLAGCDDATGSTDDCRLWTGTANSVGPTASSPPSAATWVTRRAAASARGSPASTRPCRAPPRLSRIPDSRTGYGRCT